MECILFISGMMVGGCLGIILMGIIIGGKDE